MSPSPSILYKYVDQEGARKIIANGTLRFGRPGDMNDPFDVYIDDLFNVGLEEMQERSIAKILDLLQQDPIRLASFLGVNPAKVQSVSGLINSITPSDRSRLFAAITPAAIENEDKDLAEIWKRMEPQRQAIIAQYRNSGIFCVSSNHDNLLMWAHYAQQHRGVVLGFRPGIEQDSFLAITKPVRYSDTRPKFYKPIDDMIANGADFTEEDIREFREILIYTKSSHWMYEQELRIDIPHGVPIGQSATFLKFYPTELCEMYLGIRAVDPFKSEIIAAARALNPDASIFEARLEKESYALAFDPIM